MRLTVNGLWKQEKQLCTPQSRQQPYRAECNLIYIHQTDEKHRQVPTLRSSRILSSTSTQLRFTFRLFQLSSIKLFLSVSYTAFSTFFATSLIPLTRVSTRPLPFFIFSLIPLVPISSSRVSSSIGRGSFVRGSRVTFPVPIVSPPYSTLSTLTLLPSSLRSYIYVIISLVSYYMRSLASQALGPVVVAIKIPVSNVRNYYYNNYEFSLLRQVSVIPLRVPKPSVTPRRGSLNTVLIGYTPQGP